MSDTETRLETPDASTPANDARNARVGKGKSGRGSDIEALSLQVEAALLTTDRATPASKLAEALNATAKAVADAIDALNAVYDKTGRSFRVEQLANGYQILTLPQYAEVLAALHKTRAQSKLGPAMLETLAIIAYKQPILRADVEAIRGVACGEVIRALMDRHLVKIVGRAEEIGRPMLYGTTKAFLELFGLASLKDLPRSDELRPRSLDEPAPRPPAEDGSADGEPGGAVGQKNG